ncbi:hormogonium polysaccharide biosynthesis protein HpsA [Cronbergia sp. UHCC 0137]|uniref:hormogonium polysaccharide biosynthesis protein HpsA n=1 Tax=Cronbergia sp. UHCC 0137 TaxID=3110239 RepID=UPI002B220F74|nr:hormogonium polysaccharide biosynthesis protein HpsA [Cronbergia sp. UHCC 0137]MEA5617081.1 hormogonium polysaccharide biosynthesis protein HpsA [Cronbergia sp. UHCC 0137]
MSTKYQPFRAIKKVFKQLGKKFLATVKKQIIWLLRSIAGLKKQQNSTNAGFVLPTLAMVSLVVVLLSGSIMLRSFERAKNASNVRVNEAVINAATPAIDRSRAKLNKLFDEPTLPRVTPSDKRLYKVLVDKLNQYTFGDEVALTLDSKESTCTNKTVDNAPECFLRTAWRFPVDTDSNGKFDSYTIYGIYFNNPPVVNNAYSEARTPVQARALPMASGEVGGQCTNATGSASLINSNGWIRYEGSKFKKAIFVYTATVPLTNSASLPNTTNYEIYQGNKSFSAVEYQQDRSQIIPADAVVYEDDIELIPGPAFNLNGRVFTNSNFLTFVPSEEIRLYQISGLGSCFYKPENAKIIIGGNLAQGGFTTDTDQASRSTQIDLFKPDDSNPDTDDSPVKTGLVSSYKNSAPRDVAYNNLAYVQRVNRLVQAHIASGEADPTEVEDGIENKKDRLKEFSSITTFTTAETAAIRREQLELYFKNRTRRVPFKEIPFGTVNALVGGINNSVDYSTTSPLQGSGDTLRPVDDWSYPLAPANGKDHAQYSKLELNLNSNKLEPKATKPDIQNTENGGREDYVGDRVIIGNNLPYIWWNGTSSEGEFVSANPSNTQKIEGVFWEVGSVDDEDYRTRYSTVKQLADVGSIDRNGTWELAAAEVPVDAEEPIGGLRVITGAGIYLREADTAATTTFPGAEAVWPDLMPMNPPSTAEVRNPYSFYDPELRFESIVRPATVPRLKMRATAVYHYKSSGYDETNPTPIACISSFYDPTNATTAKNQNGLPWNANASGQSNSGIVYGPPTRTESNYSALLAYQAGLTYQGRSIDDGLLSKALAKTAANRTLSEKSTIDAQICALQIMDGTISVATSPPVPHGAIFETAFLDGRQVKTVHTDTITSDILYDRPLQDRQPLEIRATVLDLNLLRGKTIGNATPSQEYLLPNSGIIYATRNDALLDLSAGNTDQGKLESPLDYILDPTRRPNAIMLINGQELGRETNYRNVEKGLTLATNLPTYIKGDFNLHTQTEFKDEPANIWTTADFYSGKRGDSANQNPNFACRPNDPRLPSCTVGDKWRPATVLTDAITLLSNNFREGFRNEGYYDQNFVEVSNKDQIKWPGYFNPTESYSLDRNGDGVLDTINYTSLYGAIVDRYNSAGQVTETDGVKFDNQGKVIDFVTDVTGDATTTGFQGSSYLTNFVSPIVRPTKAKEYLLEICDPTPSVTACDNPFNWVITTKYTKTDWNGYDAATKLAKWKSERDPTPTNTDFVVGKSINDVRTGSITKTPTDGWENSNFLRRIAYKRDTTTGNLSVATDIDITAFGINSSGNVQEYAQRTLDPGFPPTVASQPRNARITISGGSQRDIIAPWIKSSISTSNPQVVEFQPVLQINAPEKDIDARENPPLKLLDDSGSPLRKNWLQPAMDTTFNLVMVTGDTPARPEEDNGGLHYLPRFLEHWNGKLKATISGAFMQTRKSRYATGPIYAALENNSTDFRYRISPNGGRTPFLFAPVRSWGYDVGLLSQSPDLFAQKLVESFSGDEYFREVGRDDEWVETLLCAKTNQTGTPYAITDPDQRPSICKA